MPYGTILSDERCVEYGIKTIEWASAAEIPVVNTGDGYKPNELSDEDAFKVYEERMSKLLAAAEKHKVHIAIEPHGTFSLTCRGLNRLLSLSSSQWLGINYDGCNIYRASYVESHGDDAATSVSSNAIGLEDEVETLKSVINRVVHVHAKDYKDGRCMSLGKGNVRIAECIDILKSHGYEGAVSLETEGDESFETSYCYAKESFEFLKSHCL